jgi:hypothetical protein
VRSTMCSLVLLIFSSIPGLSQNRPAAPPTPPSPHPDYSAAPASEEEATERLSRDMAKKANQERAAALKADTEKLLKLAVELKASVDKSNENLLSVEVIKKAEEIEKLAHSVKDKMKGPN